MQADAYAGFGKLYEANRKGGSIIEAACWAHGRRKFFDLARLTRAPIAAEAVKRIDILFAIEREINGLAPQDRLRVRQERSRPLIVELEAWLREQRAKLSKNNDTTKAINYCLSRWDAFTRFLDDGRLCMSNNAAERELRAVALGRSNWTFAGSDDGGRRAAEEFDAPFARLDWISRNRFDIQWHRHTGEWFCLHRCLTLAEAIDTLRSDGLLHPP